MDWTYIDVLLIAVIAASIMKGFRQGLVLGVLALSRWLGSIFIGLQFQEQVWPVVAEILEWPEMWARPAAFILLVIFGSFVIGLLGGALLRRRPPELDRHRGNRILGIIPGAISGVVSAAILSAFLLAAPLPGRLGIAAQRSALARKLQPATERVEERLTEIFGGAMGRAFSPGVGEGDRRTMTLPAKVTAVRARPDLETRMLELVNRERAAASLPPLRADAEMREVARRHSVDMFARGYFSHYTPEGKSPFDRIHDAGYKFRTAGENLAIAPTLELAHDGLMKSPGHRANILRPQFGRVGIGVIDGGSHGVMVTQNFRN